MKVTRPVRRVNRQEVACSHCSTTIPKGACVSTLFNFYACKNAVCEEAITQRYHAAKVSAKMHRVYA
jgi:hypothetical protein